MILGDFMIRVFSNAFLVVSVAVVAVFSTQQVKANDSIALEGNDCTSQWAQYSPFSDPTLLDTHATYWRYRVELPTDFRVELRVTGAFPHARYSSLSVYDQADLDAIDTLPDYSIKPNIGSQNPFLAGVNRSVANRNFEVRAIQGLDPTRKKANELVLPEGGDPAAPKAIELWYRIFFSDAGNDEHYGSAPIPQIRAFNADTGVAVACPTPKFVDFDLSRARDHRPPSPSDEKVHFYALPGSAMYPNMNNRYLAGLFRFSGGAEVGVIRFKAPTYPKTRAGIESMSGQEDVRYWSLCLGGATTMTRECIADEELMISNDGYVNVVIGPGNAGDGPGSFAAEVREKGLNYLGRGKLWVSIVLFRTFLPRVDFAGNTLNLKMWPGAEEDIPEDAEETYSARYQIGDYGPDGVQCSIEEFRKNYCGMNLFPK